MDQCTLPAVFITLEALPFLPDGTNTTNFLAVTTVAVEADDMVTSLFSIR